MIQIFWSINIIYMETNTDNFTQLTLHVRGKKITRKKIKKEDVGLHVAEKINNKTRDGFNIPVNMLY